MNKEYFVEYFKEFGILDKNNRVSPNAKNKINQEIIDFVYLHTNFVKSEDVTLYNRINLLIDGITEQAYCYCGNATKYYVTYRNFAEFCSTLCRNKCNKRVLKMKDHAINGNVFTNKETGLKRWDCPEHQKLALDGQYKKYNGSFMNTEEFKEKKKINMIEKYNVEHSMQHPDSIKKMCISQFGNYVSPEQRTDKENYYRIVWNITERNCKEIENFNLRGTSGTKDAYQVDHLISINHGFINNIEPEIIAHKCNLQMIPWQINNKKSNSCSQSLEELHEKIRDNEILFI